MFPSPARRWLVMMVHGNLFSRSRWETFLRLRAIPASGVSFSEIEVTLCDVPAVDDLVEEMAELHREEEGEERGVVGSAQLHAACHGRSWCQRLVA